MSWRKATLGEICTIEKGAIGIQKAIPGEYPLVVTAEDRKSHNEYQFDCDAVIIPLVSGTGHGHASIKRIHFQTGKFALGNILCAVIPKNNKELNAEYLYRFLDLNIENELVSRMKGMANVTLPIKEIAKIEIPIPSIEEQLEFVDKYKYLKLQSAKLSSELNCQLTLIKKLRQQLLQDAIQGKLVAQNKKDELASELLKKIKAEKNILIANKKLKKEKEQPPINLEEIPFEIPDNWVWCRLGEIIQYTENFDIQKHYSPDTIINYVDIDAIDNQNQVIREVKPKMVSDLSTRARRVLKEGYIMYSTVRPYLKNIAIIDVELQNFIGSTGFNVFTAILADLKYIFNFLLTPKLNDKYKELMAGFNSPSITNEHFEQTLIPLPPLAEQARIVQKIDDLMRHCNELEGSIKESESQNEELLQRVLREAFVGKTETKTKVNELPIPENKKAFAKQVLGGKIIQLFKDDKYFTHVKFQKLLFLAEHEIEADLNLNYYFQAAGPYDPAYMHSIATSLKRNKWYEEQNYKYIPLEKVKDIDKYYNNYFGPASLKLENIFSLLATATESQCEIIATLYAVWNNRIIKKEEITDALLISDFYCWSPRKEQYQEQQLVTALTWMREHDITPNGFGKEIKKAKNKK